MAGHCALGIRLAAGLTALMLVAGPLTAAKRINWDRIDLDKERAAIEYFQSQDQRLQNVGWKLVRGNAAFCERVIPSIGLQLQDLASYGSPEVARAALKLGGDFAVQTAAAGSPSAQSGAFPANREIARIATYEPNTWEAGERLYWQRLTRVHDAIDLVLEAHDHAEFTFADGSVAKVAPVPVCATRFELMGSGDRAVADGARVVIGIEFAGFDYPEEIFAGVVAHELAHNLLGHSAWLDRNGRGRGNVRKTEREADRLMPWIMANAGYDPMSAARFFEENQPYSGGVLFIPGTHDRWQKRRQNVEAEIPLIQSVMDRHGSADWQTHFRREIDPQAGLEGKG